VQLGTENRKKVIALAVVGVLAVISVGYALLSTGGSAPPAVAAAPGVTGTAETAHHLATRGKKVRAPRSLDPSLRFDLLKISEDTKYEGNGRNIFKAEAEIPQPVAPVMTPEQKQAMEHPAPPPPPPINLKFFGFASGPGEPKRIFLAQGEDVFIAAEGEIVDRRYKVVHISPTSVEVEDVLNNNHQNLPLMQG